MHRTLHLCAVCATPEVGSSCATCGCGAVLVCEAAKCGATSIASSILMQGCKSGSGLSRGSRHVSASIGLAHPSVLRAAYLPISCTHWMPPLQDSCMRPRILAITSSPADLGHVDGSRAATSWPVVICSAWPHRKAAELPPQSEPASARCSDPPARHSRMAALTT